jgi:homoserine kinase
LAGQPGILGVALSGAGPAVLLVIEPDAAESVIARIHNAAADPSLEVIETAIGPGAQQAILG